MSLSLIGIVSISESDINGVVEGSQEKVGKPERATCFGWAAERVRDAHATHG